MAFIAISDTFRLEDLVFMAPEGKKARLYNLADFNKGRDKVIHDPYGVSFTLISLGQTFDTFFSLVRMTWTPFAFASSDFTLHVKIFTFVSMKRESDLEPRALPFFCCFFM